MYNLYTSNDYINTKQVWNWIYSIYQLLLNVILFKNDWSGSGEMFKNYVRYS